MGKKKKMATIYNPRKLTVDVQRNYYDHYDPINSVFGITFFNYYITYISIIFHLMTMSMMSWWCDSSKLCVAYSFQVLLLHAFSWAIPDDRFRDWCHKRAVWFYVVGGLNIAIWISMIVFGLFFYYLHTDGIMQFVG